jgi:hypothetical protein
MAGPGKRKSANKAAKKASKKTRGAKAQPVRAGVGKKASAGSRTPGATAKAVAESSGPVTLEEAKALAQATRPKLAARSMRKSAAPPASPARVGAERERLEKERQAEFAERIREYKATMDIMKRRGARRRRPKGVKAGGDEPVAKGGSFQPLQIFAEGDSWFDYPALFFGGGIVPRLEDRLGVPILNLAKAGDEVRFMLGVEERALLTEQLRDGCPAGGPWDVLLFSGGGNDIVDNPMALWIRDWDAAKPAAELIHQVRFDAAMSLVRAAYEDLITMRNRLSPDTHLVFHGYDFAIPDGRGICGFGPWLKPTFDLRGFPNRASAQEVVKIMLGQFADMLRSLEGPTVTFVNGQGTLAAKPSSWHNELHPAEPGFEKFADLFHTTLKTLFPERVA